MKLAFFDIDGTLATGKHVPDSAKKGIGLFRENGGTVFICTGRNYRYVQNNFSDYADGCICNNGRLAYHEGQLIFEDPLTQEQIISIRRILDDLKAGYVLHSTENGYYHGPEKGYDYMREVGDPGYLQKSIPASGSFYNFDIWYDSLDHLNEIAKALEGICIINPHGPHPSADMTVIGTDKAVALKAVSEKLHVPLQDTYAFGDGMNDISMLKTAGHGIAMGNGQQETKDAAEHVTDSIDDDGIYNALKHYGLI